MSTAAPAPVSTTNEAEHLNALSALALGADDQTHALNYVLGLDEAGRRELLSLADSHHVTLRALVPVQQHATACGNGKSVSWITDAIEREHARIENALKHLHHICSELEDAGCPVVIIKSLDHTPDLGNDLDLYSTAPERKIVEVMKGRLGAEIEARSWGDRLANKWNFKVPGLPESVEIHVQRLGQTGEHTQLARRFVTRRVPREVGGYTFLVPAPEERIIVATLQRMYRHFYFRVCDVVNTANLVNSGTLDYAELERAAKIGGIWPGVATYLKIASDYVARYRHGGLALPQNVLRAARFGGEKLSVRARFLRVPMMPEGATLYTEQVKSTALRGDVPATLRLSLLPPLASAAAIAYRITGSDKGIW